MSSPTTSSSLNQQPKNTDNNDRKGKRTRSSPYACKMFIVIGLLVLGAVTLLVYTMVISFLRNNQQNTDNNNKSVMDEEGQNVGPFKDMAINTDHHECTKAALYVMNDLGGTAVDGAISALLCVGVVNLFSAGLGGGGFMLVAPSSIKNDSSLEKESTFFDFRETAPSKATPDMFYGRPPELSVDGTLSVAVPGEVLGMWQAKLKHPSSVPWKALFEPSIRLARQGFPMHERLFKMAGFHRARIVKFAELRQLLFLNDDGNAVKPIGTIIKRENLAHTLELIAENGPQIFYNGSIGKAIVKIVQDQGGIMTMEDLQDYTVKERPALCSKYRGFDLVTGGPPCSGAVIAFILSTLEHFPLKSPYNPNDIHAFIEADKFGYAARQLLADPDFIVSSYDVNKVVKQLRDPEMAKMAAGMIDMERTFPSEYYQIFDKTFGKGGDIPKDQGTAHVSIVDLRRETKFGKHRPLSVSVTSTINVAFGSLLLDHETGILLNDEMDDFSAFFNGQMNTTNDIRNAYDLPISKANQIAPGKRAMSSASPLILYFNPSSNNNNNNNDKEKRKGKSDGGGNNDKEVFAVIGGVGGSKIISTVAKFIVDWLDFALSPAAGVRLPRWHHQLIPDELIVEPYKGRYSESLVESLGSKGHHIKTVRVQRFYSGITMLIRRRDDLQWYGATDPRKPGGSVDGL